MVDDPGLEHPLNPRLRELDPRDPGRQRGTQGVHGRAVRPDQAGRILLQGDGLPAAAADRVGGPVGGRGPTAMRSGVGLTGRRRS